jgi:ribosomal protein L37AE/L43A
MTDWNENEANPYDRAQAAEECYRADWAGDYDGTECPNCGRLRMMMCANGKRRCEKCNYDPDAGRYSDYAE